MSSIKVVDLNSTNITNFQKSFVGCLVITNDNKILLQKRGDNWDRFPGYITTFGGQIELEETPSQTLVRELKEELGATVIPAEAIYLGAITESYTNYSELIYTYLWHDKANTITGCYEGETKLFNNYSEIINNPKTMDDVLWIVNECLVKGLL